MASKAARHFDQSMFLVEKKIKIKEALCFTEMWFGLSPLLLHSLVNTLLPVALGLGKVFHGMAKNPLVFSFFFFESQKLLSSTPGKCDLSGNLRLHSALHSSARGIFWIVAPTAWAELELGTLDQVRGRGVQQEVIWEYLLWTLSAFFFCQQLLLKVLLFWNIALFKLS